MIFWKTMRPLLIFVLTFTTSCGYVLINKFGSKIDGFLGVDGISEDYFGAFPQSDLLLGLAGVVATIISVSIPIAISAISDHLKEFNSKAAFSYFTSEPIFKFQVYHFVPLVSLFTLMILWKINCITLLCLICAFFIFSLYMFKKFIDLTIEYAINRDEIIQNKARQVVTDYTQ